MRNYKKNDNYGEIVLHCARCYLEGKQEESAAGPITPTAFFVFEGQSMCEDHIKITLENYAK